MLRRINVWVFCGALLFAAGCRRESLPEPLPTTVKETVAITYSIAWRQDWPEWKRRAANFEPLMHAAANQYGVPARWLWIIAYLESRFSPEAVSPRQARGLMQFTPATAKSYGLTEPHRPAAAIAAAARLLSHLERRYGGRLDLVLAAYNAGEGAVDAYLKGSKLHLDHGRVINPQRLKTGGVPPYPETQQYVRLGLALERFLAPK